MGIFDPDLNPLTWFDESLVAGEGTLRAEPLGKALARFARPATVISESPGEESHQAIRKILKRR